MFQFQLDFNLLRHSFTHTLIIPSPLESPPTTTIALAKQMYKEDGISAFYNGVGTSTFQSATEKALYFFAYSSFKNMYTSLTSSKELGTVANLGKLEYFSTQYNL